MKASFYSTQLDDTESTDQFLTHLKASADKANAITEKHLHQMHEAQAQELQFAFPPPSLSSKSSSSSGLGSTTGSDFTFHSSLGSTAFKSKKKITQEDIKEILIDILVNHLDLAKLILEMFGFVGAGLIVEDDMLSVLLTSIHHCYEAVYNYLVEQSHLTFPEAQNHVMEHASNTFELNDQLFANRSSHGKRRKRQKGSSKLGNSTLTHSFSRSPSGFSGSSGFGSGSGPGSGPSTGPGHFNSNRPNQQQHTNGQCRSNQSCSRNPSSSGSSNHLGSQSHCFLFSGESPTSNELNFIVDSGCTRHIVGANLLHAVHDEHSVRP